MERLQIRTVLSLLLAILFLTFGSSSVYAQYYMNVYQNDGQKFHFIVSSLDSINFTDHVETPYEYVDMGLSVNWATCNIGALSPEGYGDYYAWGELPTRNNYDWHYYKYCHGYASTLSKYCTIDSYGFNGFTDNKTKLDNEDDVARVKWGGEWRMPTMAELEELCEHCSWLWTYQNGTNGYLVTSKIPGYTDRSIFLPAAGASKVGGSDYGSLVEAGSYGHYWSSMLDTLNPNYAYCLFFDSDRHIPTGGTRPYGLSIRPVCQSEEWLSHITVSMNCDSMTIGLNYIETLIANVYYEQEQYTTSFIEWSSDNPSVAIVDNEGNVTTISSGTATITASVQSKTAQCIITVVDESEITHEYVDLGLSVKWATSNLGTITPYQYGGGFAWGETDSKTEYWWGANKWINDTSGTLTKYNTSSDYGTVDNKITLDPEDDVAHVKWGGSWRMPTKGEQDELLNYCTWTWYSSGNSEFHGVAGYKVTSKKSGYTDRFIFLPAAGYRDGTRLGLVGSSGYYWSSSLNADYPKNTWFLYFDSGRVEAENSNRGIGFYVRPVCLSEEWLSHITISMACDSTTLCLNYNEPLRATVYYDQEQYISSLIEWSSDNPSVAIVDNEGYITTISNGTATITASIQSKTAQCIITVVDESEITHEYVDLGLSVKWATSNIGATTPYQYGGYFAWGETDLKTDYYWSTYKWCKGSDKSLTKYNTYSSKGPVDNKTTLDSEDDVAHVKWGGSWRMPTKAEQDELLNNCTWTWYSSGNSEFNGVAGYKVTSKKSGYTDRFIFLPAAGHRYYTELDDAGELGYYWSSSLYAGSPSPAWYLYFSSGSHRTGDLNRDKGQSVRPVCP